MATGDEGPVPAEAVLAFLEPGDDLHIPIASGQPGAGLDAHAAPGSPRPGRTGVVPARGRAGLPDLSGTQVYACGAPIVVDAARRDYVALCQLPADEFYADAFTSEADLHN